MRRLALTSFFVFLFASWTFASNFSVNLGINYNAGSADFFQESTLHLSYSGLNFVEKKHNQMGFGFNLGFNIPITKRLYIVPGVSMYFGHQQYEYTQVNATPGQANAGEDVKDTYYFIIYSGELNLMYDLFVLKNGWHINLVLGLNYNYFKADAEMLLDDEKYWGMQAGLGARFLLLRHFGFQVLGYYRLPFSDERFASVGALAGICYRF